MSTTTPPSFPVDGQGWQERHDLLMPWQVPTIERNSSTGWLVGGLEHFLFSHILGRIIPIDFHIFQRGVQTTNQGWYVQGGIHGVNDGIFSWISLIFSGSYTIPV